MSTRAIQVELPQDLLNEIDAEVGSPSRGVFLIETARAELRRRRLLAVLQNPEPAWKDEDHPELARGSDAWVKDMREGWRPRTDELDKAL